MFSAMSQDKSDCFTNMHKTSSNELSSIFIDIVFFGHFIKLSDLQKFFSRFWFSLRSKTRFDNSRLWEKNRNQDCESSKSQCHLNNKRDDGNLRREEVEMVMGKVGIFCSTESEKLKESMGSDELSQLFDEKEPSLEELKEAFDVFDEKRDGFIDAEELQKLLLKLGLKEGSTMDNCRKMITACDENGDGRIDFIEFVKFMERVFS
ncbi:probable calcium-binding protein CML46 [Manihot esculenta]|uniref:EF-hand domain-containing protein n=1 Tax=Manihot esculenta TaxID=3983 RepID=A0A2C9WKH7_MANES|nr:probable calcium-binding protein CML46 [Manihot esculenta]OAY60181.1 hypothetical protein MANES_01G092300v8 [Manihot esculenta]